MSQKNTTSPAPPHCNTGAQNTTPTYNCISLDWLEFTMPAGFRWQSIFNYLSLSDQPVVKAPKGLHGYREQYICAGVRVLTSGTPEMGHHVIISGEALRSLPDGWKQIVELVDFRGRFTRIDIAMDDVEGMLDILQIRTAVKSGSCISRFKKTRTISSTKISSGEALGETEYFGSPSSRIMVRFYDKALERELETGSRPCDHWVRCEMQLRDTHAVQIGAMLAHGDQPASFAAALLHNYISFRRSTPAANKSRDWPVASWWQRFLGCIEKLCISVPKEKKTLLEKAKWFVKQCSPTMTMLLLGLGENYMQQVFIEGKQRLTPYQRDLITLAKI